MDPYEGVDDAVIQEYAQLLGLRPSDEKLQKFVREMEERKKQSAETRKWTTEIYLVAVYECVYIYLCIRIHMYMCVCVCFRFIVYVYVYVYVCVYIYILYQIWCIYIYI